MIGINTCMKQFIPTYLYIKTHNITGLKYFGKTTGDPFDYYGSGKYWLAHLKKHGYDISTEIVGYFTVKEECTFVATKFSQENDIVNAVNENNKKIWANQIVENGLDGGYTGRTIYYPHTAETKEKISQANKGRTPWNKGETGYGTSKKGQALSEETKQKLREANLGKKQSADTIAKRSAKLKGMKRSEEFIKKMTGRKHSPEAIERMKSAQQGKVCSEETKAKIREARKKQIFTEETKKKLSGKVVVVDKAGKLSRIAKEQYYSQTGAKETWEWVFHKSKEAIMRRN